MEENLELRPALQRKSHLWFPEEELRGLSSNFHIYVFVSDYIYPGLVHIFRAAELGDRSWVIY